MEYGIIFENNSGAVVDELCEALKNLGLINQKNSTMSEDLIDALNIYRSSNGLSPLDFCDPITLRTLGIDARGDELLTLARCAEELGSCELDYYDIASEIVSESRKFGITVTEAAIRRNATLTGKDISVSAMAAAVLAFLNE